VKQRSMNSAGAVFLPAAVEIDLVHLLVPYSCADMGMHVSLMLADERQLC
jgi:hypothetical protein